MKLLDKLYFLQDSIITRIELKKIKEERKEINNDWSITRGICKYLCANAEEQEKHYLRKYTIALEKESELNWRLYTDLLLGNLKHENKLKVMEHQNQKFDNMLIRVKRMVNQD